MKLDGWIGNLALAVTATLVPLGLLEGGLRLAGTTPPSIYTPDSVLLYRLAPGGRKLFQHRPANGGNSVQVEINDAGYRGPPLRPSGSARRVVVYGDSFIEGEFVADSLSFVRQLERLLSSATPTEVVNAGVAGYGPDQSYVRMQQELPVLKPQVVVLAVFADNDFGDILRDRLVRLRADGTLERHRVTLHPTLARALATQAIPAGLRRLHLVRWLERKLRRVNTNLPLANAPSNAPRFSIKNYGTWAMFNAQQQWADAQAQPDTVVDLLGDSYDIDVAATPDSASSRAKVALMDALLGTLRRDLAARGLPFVLLIIPSPLDACDQYDVRIDTTRFPGHDRRRLSGTIDSLAARHGIRRIDLWPVMRGNDACSLYYRDGDNHWNTKGQTLVARITADSLAAWGLAR